MIQYKTNVLWDKTLCALEFIEDDAITRGAGIAGLCQFAVKITTGVPIATPGKFMKGAQIQNAFDGTWYEQTGTVLLPVWSLVPGGGSGITQLTGDVTAGPGIGSQATTIGAKKVKTGMIDDNAVDGTKIALASQRKGDLMQYNGTDWVRVPTINCFNAPGLAIDTDTKKVKTSNTFSGKCEGKVSLPTATTTLPALTTAPAGITALAGNGEQRIYTLLGTIDPTSAAITFSWVNSADLPNAIVDTSSINQGPAGTFVVGFVMIQTLTAATFTPGTDDLNDPAFGVLYIDAFGWQGL